MVKYSEIQATNIRSLDRGPLVVVSAGGTSGIGQSALRELFKTAAKNGSKGAGLRLYLIGRKPDAINKLFDEFRQSSPAAEYIAIIAKDLSLMKDVDQACQEIITSERKRLHDAARIDVLLMSQAIFEPWAGRRDTSEGLDINMSLLYYSRVRMLGQLLPLLVSRPASGPPAHVVSVYAGGAETWGQLKDDDLSLRRHYTFSGARTHVVHMKTMFFEHIANDHPGKISLVHYYPGLVVTEAFKMLYERPTPLWIRLCAPLLVPIAKHTVATPVPESGQRTLFLASDHYPAKTVSDVKVKPDNSSSPVAVATNGVPGGGAYSCTVSCETNKNLDKAYTKLRDADFYNRVWGHTHDALNTIASGEVFTK